VNWFKNPEADASAHLIIDHDGSIVQMVKLNEKAWHAGASSWDDKNGLNKYSIGIELVNWGVLKGDWGGWKSWTGSGVSDERVVVEAHKNNSEQKFGWEVYDDAQLEACILATKAIVSHYKIPEENIVGHDDISPGRKVDPGPLFDMERFKAKLFGRKSDSAAKQFYRVTAANGLNMRVSPGIDGEKITKLNSGTRVTVIQKEAPWWLVSIIKGNSEDETGWVHSRWLIEI